MRSLAAAYQRLDRGQRRAVDNQSSTVVIAGPGSGKTETLAVKAACLLQEIPPPRSIACITYTRSASREIRQRVDELVSVDSHRFFCGTLHGFCLRHILAPYATLVDEAKLKESEIIGPKRARQLLSQINGLADTRLSDAELVRLRRSSVAREPFDPGFSDADIAAMHRYETRLEELGLLDYDAIIHEAVRLVDENPIIVELLASRFPWLLVDEYQDLGAALHTLIQSLRDTGGTEIFAVGDPDQTIMQFTGADARYIRALADRGYLEVPLPFNYRSAPELVRAAVGACSSGREYTHDPENQSAGEVVAREVTGGFATQLSVLTTEIVPACLEQYPAHEIAIFYTQKGWYASQLTAALEDAEIAFSLERDTRFNQLGEVVGWLQRCAQWSIDAWDERQGRFRSLADELHDIRAEALGNVGSSSLDAAVFLMPILEAPVHPDASLAEWLIAVLADLQLEDMLVTGGFAPGELEGLQDLLAVVNADPSLTIQDFAGPVSRPGRIVVTTYHSAKGRTFDAVILPGLQDGVMPRAFKAGGAWRFGDLLSDQNLFYVAITRPRHSLTLLWSGLAENSFGDAGQWRKSRFLTDILHRI